MELSFLAPLGDSLSFERLRRFGDVDFLVKPRGPKTPLQIFAKGFAKSLLDSIKKVSTKFDVVVSTGCNFCIPPALVAWAKGIPVVNIESPVRFVKPSKTAMLLQPFSKLTALHWEEQRNFLDGVVTGPLLPKPKLKPWRGGYILVTGGTYGHKLLFDALSESNLENVVLQTGRVDPEPYLKRHPEWKVFKVTESFHRYLAGAEVVVTHYGATLLEVALYKKPAVIVPNPEWTRTAGIEDAVYMAKKLNAVLVSKIDVETLIESIEKAKRRTVPSLPNGAENLAELIMEL
ncbi:polysaccharide biosynthesis protein [Candidatus Bathyarchaeota archaeon ex4484_40]|nr:MAG: polysaccharide biosynthesis protein [Candidatus Bathyarchaeota archaeon ex4484_40]